MLAVLSLVYLFPFNQEELLLSCALLFWFFRLLVLGGLLNITNVVEGRFNVESYGAGGGGDDIEELGSLSPINGDRRNVPFEYFEMT